MPSTLALIEGFNWFGVLFFMTLGAIVGLLARRSIVAHLWQPQVPPAAGHVQTLESLPNREPLVRQVEHRHVHVLERRGDGPTPTKFVDVVATVTPEPTGSKSLVRR